MAAELRKLLDRLANVRDLGVAPPYQIGRRWETLLNTVLELRAESGTVLLEIRPNGR